MTLGAVLAFGGFCGPLGRLEEFGHAYPGQHGMCQHGGLQK